MSAYEQRYNVHHPAHMPRHGGTTRAKTAAVPSGSSPERGLEGRREARYRLGRNHDRPAPRPARVLGQRHLRHPRRTEIIEIAAKVTSLDRVLTAYGPDAAKAQALFREAVAEGIRGARTDEADAVRTHMFPPTRADYLPYAAILGLSPRNDTQRDLKARAVNLAVDIQQPRALLLVQEELSSPLKPLLFAVICWLIVIFVGFGLLAPSNATATVALIAADISVTSAIFLIMELDQPLGGIIRLSGEPILNAMNLIKMN